MAAIWIQGLQVQRETSFLGGLALEPGCSPYDATKKVLSDADPGVSAQDARPDSLPSLTRNICKLGQHVTAGDII